MTHDGGVGVGGAGAKVAGGGVGGAGGGNRGGPGRAAAGWLGLPVGVLTMATTISASVSTRSLLSPRCGRRVSRRVAMAR